VIGLPQVKRIERSSQLVLCDKFVNCVTKIKMAPNELLCC
jgi:hypothetical protein